MNVAQLVRMANQIGAFFVTMPDQTKAAAGIAEHLRKFWEPRMRRDLLAFLDQHPDGRSGNVVLDPVVRNALESHRIALTPMKPAPSITTVAASDQ